MIRILDDSIKNKTILYRSPYDIGIKKENGKFIIKDDSRIKVTIPTLEYLLKNNCKIVILTWVKRPNGIDKSLSTKPIASHLEKILNHPVKHIDDCVGDKVKKEIKNLKPKEILMLENTRFYKQDYKEDKDFSKKLINGCDLIVFDAFPQSHREVSSTTGILKLLPSFAGLYFKKEIDELNKLINNPSSPFCIIIGGAKISDKIDAINNLIKKCDYVLIGGATANIFLKAKGYNMADSLIENTLEGTSINPINIATNLLKHFPRKIILPTDLLISDKKNNPTKAIYFDLLESKMLPKGSAAFDIGDNTIMQFTKVINKSKTIFFNGPMGFFENNLFKKGTINISNAVSNSNSTSVIAGGDTIESIKNLRTKNNITHISVAGTATMKYLAKEQFNTIKLLSK